MKTIETFLPVFPGFYGTIFEADTESELYSQNQERDSSLPEIEYDDLDFDNKEYENEVVKQCTSFIEDQLKPMGLVTAIRFQSINSPREYNFANDSGNIEIDLTNKNIKAIKDYLKANADAYAKYLKGTYTSCDGFWSHYGNSIEEWSDYTDGFKVWDNHAHHLGSVLQFICWNEDITDESMYESLEVYVGEYCKYRTDQVKCESCGEWFEKTDSPEHKEYERIKATQVALYKERTGHGPLVIKTFKECYPEYSFLCDECK